MNLLGLDFGSSSVKAAVLRNGRTVTKIVRAGYETRHEGVRVEVPADAVLRAAATVIGQLGARAKKVDAVALSVMSPACVVMDAKGKALTPLITHQDRRSLEQARELEKRVGKERYLQIAGNRPFPGGISATTFAWYRENEPQVMARADLVGHLNTFLHRQITGSRVIDTSNASFTGLYRTTDLGGWSDELCEAVGISPKLLPEVLDGDRIGGTVAPQATRRFGLREGTPVLVGIVDGSSPMLLAGARAGQLLNVCGSTDVLALCTAEAKPHEKLLTRALGIGRKWLSVSTIAAAGSALNWTHDQLFADLSRAAFQKLMKKLSRKEMSRTNQDEVEGGVRFEPYLAGERTTVEQRRGAFTGLTLSTTREQMLAAVIDALAEASAARFQYFREIGAPMRRQKVLLTGGVQDGLAQILQRDWPGKWSFKVEEEATLRGLAYLTPRKR